jgi:pyruvate dehydrogenase E1 component alpha subunit
MGEKGGNMLFKEFDPHNEKLFQVMDNDGNIIASQWKPEIPEDVILDSYKLMQFVRTADLMTVSYQRQGRMFTYPPNIGQEAVHAGIGKQIREQDWLVPAFREMGMYLLKGAKLSDIFLYWGGYEDGSKFSGAANFLPLSVPIGSQLVHGLGIGYAVKLKKQDSVVFAVIGDGGTSEGDFHEALNIAGAWKVPVVFIIQNNQYAISVPVHMQTAAKSLAIKACAYGMPGIQVDGNDFFAVYRATQEAIAHAKAGNGPVLIEAMTYRQGAHTTSDDPTLYRTEKEEEEWKQKDPIKRLRGYLVSQGAWKEEEDEPLVESYKKEVEKEFAVYENHPAYKVEDVFKYIYKEMPEDLKQQQMAYEKFLNWQEAQK